MKAVTIALCAAAPRSADAADSPAASGSAFDIDEYVVDGNTVLPELTIDQAVYPFLGPQRSADDVEAARAALEEAYHAGGYQTVAVTIPAQNAAQTGGVVHLQVLEASVGRLRMVGAQYHSLSEVKADAPSVQEGKVPNFNDLQQDITHLNQWPDRTVTPVMRAGKDPGTVDVDLTVEDHLPVQASLELNNRQSLGTTPLRLMGTVGYDNLWQLGHSVSLSFQLAPENPSDAKVISGNYIARFRDSPFSLQLSGFKSDSNVSTIGSTDVIGNGQDVGIRLIATLPGTVHFSQSVSIGVDYKDFLEDDILLGQESKIPLTYYPLSINYLASLTEDQATDTANVTLNMASPDLGSNAAAFDNKRYEANGEDLWLKADFSRLQKLPWGIQAYMHVAGQITDQPLVSSEQFVAGGYDTVRGYLEAEEVGDYGVLGGVELRSPSAAAWVNRETALGDTLDDLRLIAFFESAQLWLRTPLPEQRAEFALESIGAGLRIKLLEHLNGAVDVAVPLITAQQTVAGSHRVLFRLWSEY